MTMLVLLDSTVLIDYLRGRPAVRRVDDLQRGGDVPCTTAINIEEIVRGLRSREERACNDLIAGLEVLPIGSWEGWRAGMWRRDFARRGVTLWQADCLIAAAAVSANAVLATGNPKDFPMRELEVEPWPVGA
jgi:predicted nucleic acid-binding protein